jgi:DNA helicase II / ATP-dependent DNA helicase PcrA
MSDPFELTEAASAPAPLSPATPASYLSTLNDTQSQAVQTIDGPVLVLAGAGTGKTRVLTTRMAHILMQGKARPWEVLAVTFTNKAAREMKERVAMLVNRPVEGWWVGTFHAIGARMLRNHAEAAGLKPNFTILDTDDQVRLIKQLVDIHDLDDKRWPPGVIAGTIQRWKDRGLMPDGVTAAEGSDIAEGRILSLYTEYQNRLQVLNAADFGDLLLLCLNLFKQKPEILTQFQQQFRYILVDEYQDTNVAQYLWLRLLAQGHRNICCVGDDDQSIYSWRGAEVGNILRFEEDFPGAGIVRLERNYRSTPHILAAASGLISHNEGRLGKTLWTDINEGDKVKVQGVWDGEEEARTVGEEIESLHAKGNSLNEMAILVRASFQTREFEERMITLGIPYRVIGGARFYERQEIRDAIAYLRVTVQPDDDLAFERIVNLPKRGLGKAAMQTIHQYARAERLPLTRAVLQLVETDEFKPKVRKTLSELMNDFARWRSLVTSTEHAELAGIILDESGYATMWQESKAPEAPGRLDNLKEMIVALEDFENLGEFLEHVSLVMENEDSASDDKVTMMTLHGAKGLEFETVFLPGWEEGLFPHQRALDEGGAGGLEEERRLAYVGITRAGRRARIMFAANRRIYGKWQSSYPSRFIDELPPDHVETETSQGLYGSERPSRGAGRGSGFADGSGGFSLSPRNRRRVSTMHQQLDGDSWKTDERHSSEGAFAMGERVFHQKFGYGRVVAIDGNKLEIDFEKAGTKKVVDSFVEAT